MELWPLPMVRRRLVPLLMLWDACHPSPVRPLALALRAIEWVLCQQDILKGRICVSVSVCAWAHTFWHSLLCFGFDAGLVRFLGSTPLVFSPDCRPSALLISHSCHS